MRRPDPTARREVPQELEHVTLLREHALAGAIQRGMAAVEAQTATLMGRLVWDASGQRDHAAAGRYYEQAIHAAAGAKEGWAEAFPRLFQAFLTIYGHKNTKTGLDLATRAARRAGNGSSHVIGGWAWALTGVANARLGNERPARVALDRAPRAPVAFDKRESRPVAWRYAPSLARGHRRPLAWWGHRHRPAGRVWVALPWCRPEWFTRCWCGALQVERGWHQPHPWPPRSPSWRARLATPCDPDREAVADA